MRRSIDLCANFRRRKSEDCSHARSDPGRSAGQKSFDAVNARNYPRARSTLARQLTQHYPQNAVATVCTARSRSGFGNLTKRRPIRRVIALQPGFSSVNFGLGLSEAGLGRYAVALQNFQQLARLEPKAEIAWIASSSCAERIRASARTVLLTPNALSRWRQYPLSSVAPARASRERPRTQDAAQRRDSPREELGPPRSTSTPARKR